MDLGVDFLVPFDGMGGEQNVRVFDGNEAPAHEVGGVYAWAIGRGGDDLLVVVDVEVGAPRPFIATPHSPFDEGRQFKRERGSD